MKRTWLVVPLFLLCGCLVPATVPTVSYWTVDFRGSTVAERAAKFDVARLVQVVVALPYAGERMVVLRQDGTVAFDDYNVFAAPPSALLKWVCGSALKASGLFSDVVGASSSALAPFSVECIVSRLAIDCRQESSRQAVAALQVRILKGKTTIVTAEGEGVADASDGDYGVAFSKAVSAALESALSKVR